MWCYRYNLSGKDGEVPLSKFVEDLQGHASVPKPAILFWALALMKDRALLDSMDRMIPRSAQMDGGKISMDPVDKTQRSPGLLSASELTNVLKNGVSEKEVELQEKQTQLCETTKQTQLCQQLKSMNEMLKDRRLSKKRKAKYRQHRRKLEMDLGMATGMADSSESESEEES